ncbi:hypothetical protein [Devosia riboflavina]|nr:hypothetical protein [Devosia riboflavina]
MRTISILVFIACFAVSIGGVRPQALWQELIFGTNAEGTTAAN